MLQEVTVQVSQDTFAREGSRQQEQPQETLIYNGIWVKALSSPKVELTGHSPETSGEVGRKVSGGLWMKKTKKWP